MSLETCYVNGYWGDSRSSISTGFPSVDSTNCELKIFRKKSIRCEHTWFSCCEQWCVNHAESVCAVLGIMWDLERIQNACEDAQGLYRNAGPFYLGDLVIFGFWCPVADPRTTSSPAPRDRWISISIFPRLLLGITISESNVCLC